MAMKAGAKIIQSKNGDTPLSIAMEKENFSFA